MNHLEFVDIFGVYLFNVLLICFSQMSANLVHFDSFHPQVYKQLISRFGIWQTMLNKTALQIQQRDFPNGYIIIIVAAEPDDFCQIANENNKCENRTDYLEKRIKITESVNTFSETTLTALFVIIGIYAVIIIFSLSLSTVCFCLQSKKFENMKDEVDIKKVPNNDDHGCLPACVNPERGETDEEEPNHESEDTLYVSDLNKKLHEPNKSKSNYQKSTLFMGNLLLMSIFYSLAATGLPVSSQADHLRQQ